MGMQASIVLEKCLRIQHLILQESLWITNVRDNYSRQKNNSQNKNCWAMFQLEYENFKTWVKSSVTEMIRVFEKWDCKLGMFCNFFSGVAFKICKTLNFISEFYTHCLYIHKLPNLYEDLNNLSENNYYV